MIDCEIVYIGAGLSGRSTSLAFVLAKHGIKSSPLEVGFGNEVSFTARKQDQKIAVSARILSKRSHSHYQVATEASVGVDVLREIQLLRRADGVVVVLDAQSERAPANRHELTKLRRDLEGGNGERPARVVYQLNKCDLPSAVSSADACALYGIDQSSIVESIAIEGRGVMEAFYRVLPG